MCGTYVGGGVHHSIFLPWTRDFMVGTLASLALKVNVLLMPEGGGGLQGFQMTGAQHTSFELKPEEFKPVQNLCVILGYSKKVMYYTKINWDGSHGLHEVLKFLGF